MRPLILSALLLGFLAGSVTAQEVAARNGAKAEVINGEVVIHFAEQKTEWPPAVAVAAKKEEVAGKRIVLTFEAMSAESDLPARVVISDFAPPYAHLADNQSIKIASDWKPYSLTFSVAASAGEKVNLPLLVFTSSPLSGEVRLRNIKVAPAN